MAIYVNCVISNQQHHYAVLYAHSYPGDSEIWAIGMVYPEPIACELRPIVNVPNRCDTKSLIN